MAKIIIPTNKKLLLELAKKIVDKHVADGDTSPLDPVLTTESQQLISEGIELNTQSESIEKEKEKVNKERDAKADEVTDIVKRSRDILKGVHRDNLRKLGDYGFTVNG